jgi:hypothetical protein
MDEASDQAGKLSPAIPFSSRASSILIFFLPNSGPSGEYFFNELTIKYKKHGKKLEMFFDF